MSKQPSNLIQEDEISLVDVIDFMSQSWKKIVLTGLFGTLFSITYLAITPNEYQATAQIKIAQAIGGGNSFGVSVEQPSLMVARLKSPSSYTVEDVKACGFENEPYPKEALAANAKFTVITGVESMVELKINRKSKELANNCAKFLFESIKTYQGQAIKPAIDNARLLLTHAEQMLSSSKSLVLKADKSGAALSAGYLSSRDEIKALTEEISRLNSFINSAELGQARLLSPVFASDVPVFPNKKLSLIIGLVAGLLLGLLFAMFKKL